jgi:hypothetical protein
MIESTDVDLGGSRRNASFALSMRNRTDTPNDITPHRDEFNNIKPAANQTPQQAKPSYHIQLEGEDSEEWRCKVGGSNKLLNDLGIRETLCREAVAKWKRDVSFEWKPMDTSTHTCRVTPKRPKEGVSGFSSVPTRNFISVRKSISDRFDRSGSFGETTKFLGESQIRTETQIQSETQMRSGIKGSDKMICFNETHRSIEADEPRELSCDMAHIVTDVYETSYPGSIHLCIRGYCGKEGGEANLHRYIIGTLDEIYACYYSGKEHLCGPFFCKEMNHVNNEGVLVCPISGRTINEVYISNKHWKFEYQRVSGAYTTADSKTRADHDEGIDLRDVENLYENCHNIGTTPIKIKKRRSGASSKMGGGMETPPTGEDLRREYLGFAIVKLALYFSAERFESDMKREKEKEAEILKQFSQYVSKYMQKGLPLNVIDLHIIACNLRRRSCPAVDMRNLTDDQRNFMIRHYARMCLSLWYIVRTRTKKGIEEPKLFSWPDFVDSAMLIFADGFEVSAQDYTHKVTLIPKDPLLGMLPEDSGYADGKYQGHSRRKGSSKRSKKINPTKLKNFITTALMNAIVKEHVNPETLRIDILDLETVDTSVFTKLRGKL